MERFKIGRYDVGQGLFTIWSQLYDEHLQSKESQFSTKLKDELLSIIEWQQYLVDRQYIFSILEKKIDVEENTHNLVAKIFLKIPKRSELLKESFPQFDATEAKLSRNAIEIGEIIMQSSKEALEWHAFVQYSELWFGGAVHSTLIKKIIRKNLLWQKAYFDNADGITNLFENIKKLKDVKNRKIKDEYLLLDKITAFWAGGGNFTEKIDFISEYFNLLSEKVDDYSRVSIDNATYFCKDAFNLFNRLMENI